MQIFNIFVEKCVVNKYPLVPGDLEFREFLSVLQARPAQTFPKEIRILRGQGREMHAEYMDHKSQLHLLSELHFAGSPSIWVR